MIKLKNIAIKAQVSKELWYHIEYDISLEECVFRYGSKKYFLIMNEAKSLMKEGYKFDWKTNALLETDLGEFDIYEGEEVPLDFPLITEAKKKKKKKKDPPIGKPKRGGSKAYYVYVRDPKTKRIKKVTFGSGGLKAKIGNKEASQAFAKRHDCKNKKDRTKASYWSCNLPIYHKQLGLATPASTFW